MCSKVSGDMQGTEDGGRANITPLAGGVEDRFGLLMIHA
jgi:hypothetical protein